MPKEKNESMVIIEDWTSLADSLLWKAQDNLYQKLGPQSWSKYGVPFYITSNPYIANYYAEVIARFLLRQKKTVEPFYIFELGVGSGRFSYLFLQYLEKYIPDLNYCLVLVDFVKENLNVLKKHSYLQKWQDQGVLDFACANLLEDDSLKLWNSNKEISEGTLSTPLTVVANYFFDTVKHNLYAVKSGKLYQGEVQVSLPEDVYERSYLKNNMFWLDNLVEEYRFEIAEEDLFLKEYIKLFSKDFKFYAPTGAFKVVDLFMKLSKGKLCILSGDQGVATTSQIYDNFHKKISTHTSFSIGVNYHLFSEYIKRKGGKSSIPEDPHTEFVLHLSFFGVNSIYLKPFDPRSYWRFTIDLEKSSKELPIEHIHHLLKLGHWDPSFLYIHKETLLKLIINCSIAWKERWYQTILHVFESFFPISKEEAVFFVVLAQILHCLEKDEKAVEILLKSLELNPDYSPTFFHLGISYRSLKKEEDSERCFQKSKEILTFQ